MKLVIVLAALVLLCAVLAAIWGANRFLIRFVFQKINGPLVILSDGVREIGEGSLDYRIDYREKDKFAPVCQAFNEMAARLKASVERTRQDEESRKELLAGISHDLRFPADLHPGLCGGPAGRRSPDGRGPAALSDYHQSQGGGHRPHGVPAVPVLQAGHGGVSHGAPDLPSGRICHGPGCGNSRRIPGQGPGYHGGIALPGERPGPEESGLGLSREELYEKIWGLEAMGDNATVAVHINRLREKIESDPAKPRYIQTVWGAGYRSRGQ